MALHELCLNVINLCTTRGSRPPGIFGSFRCSLWLRILLTWRYLVNSVQELTTVFCCRDLAVDLRLKLGDWFRVVQLLKTGGGGGKSMVYLMVYFSVFKRGHLQTFNLLSYHLI